MVLQMEVILLANSQTAKQQQSGEQKQMSGLEQAVYLPTNGSHE
jgi:hypothetical protein